MIQIPSPGPLPPGFIPPPLDWFQFAILYLAGVEVVLLSLPRKWQREIIQILFWTRWNG
jgi:hypothetical protein